MSQRDAAIRRFWWSHMLNDKGNAANLRLLCELDAITEAVQHAMVRYPYFVKMQYSGLVKLFKSKGQINFSDQLVKCCFRRAFVALGEHEVASVTGDYVTYLGLRLASVSRLEDFTVFLLNCLLTGRRHQVYRVWLPRIFLKKELKPVFDALDNALLDTLYKEPVIGQQCVRFTLVYNDYVLQSWLHTLGHLLKQRDRTLSGRELKVLEVASQSAHMYIRMEAWKCISQAQRKDPQNRALWHCKDQLAAAAVALNEHAFLDFICAGGTEPVLLMPQLLIAPFVDAKGRVTKESCVASAIGVPTNLSAYWRLCDHCDVDTIFYEDDIPQFVDALFDDDGNMRRTASTLLHRRFTPEQLKEPLENRVDWQKPLPIEVIRLFQWALNQGQPFAIPNEVPPSLKVLVVGAPEDAATGAFQACRAQIEEALKEGGSTGTTDVLTPGQLAAYLADEDDEAVEITDELKSRIQNYAARLIQASQAVVTLARDHKELIAESCSVVEEILLRSQHKGVLEACTKRFRELCELAKQDGGGSTELLQMVDKIVLSKDCRSRDLCFARIYSTICLVWREKADDITRSLLNRYTPFSRSTAQRLPEEIAVQRRLLCILNHLLITVKLDDNTLAETYNFVISELPENKSTKLHAKVWNGLIALMASTLNAIFSPFPEKVSYAEFLTVRSPPVLQALFDGLERFSKLPWAFNEHGLFVFEAFERLVLLDELMVDEAELSEPNDDPESQRIDALIETYITQCSELRNTVRDLLDSNLITEPRVRRQLAHIIVNLSAPTDLQQLLTDASLPKDILPEIKQRLDENQIGTARTEVTEFEGNLTCLASYADTHAPKGHHDNHADPAEQADEAIPTCDEVSSGVATESTIEERMAAALHCSRFLNEFGVTLNAYHLCEALKGVELHHSNVLKLVDKNMEALGFLPPLFPLIEPDPPKLLKEWC